ncbi:Hypothetical protein PHPALM_36541 [Phytophthora palmivora]|uniref:Jacalin-type lectin domain-containing protein n=1 Tax=Phytophthora palmivora TaxID=4796 RepID=A0A2P4WZN6_9STRA|nr:Hypothetical protein PHPALM_36541 [Phytophthora palmivora]
MKFFYQVLAVVALATSAVTALPKGVMRGDEYGGPHGDKYDDIDRVGPGQSVKSISLRSADRVDYVGLDIESMSGQKSLLEHGGGGGDKNTMTMGDGEHITSVEVHWGKYYRKTRVMYVKFTTDKGNFIEGGTPQDNTDKIAIEEADEGYQLGGFSGFAGHELDQMGCLWTSIKPVE